MPDEANNKTKKIGGLDVEKAREIILDAIGDKKRRKKDNAAKTPTRRDSAPLFFKDGKNVKTKGEIELSESEKARSAEEVKRAIGEGKKKNEVRPPLPRKKEEYAEAKKENKRKSANKPAAVKQKRTSPPRARRKTTAPNSQGRNNEARKRGGALIGKSLAPRKKVPFPAKRSLSVIGVAVLVFLAAVLLFAMFYSLFVFSVIRFDIDNKAVRELSEYLPVPVAITENGVIEYYRYKDALNRNIGK